MSYRLSFSSCCSLSTQYSDFLPLVLFLDGVFPVHCFNCNSKAVSPLDLLLHIPLCFLVCIIHREEGIVCVWNTQADEHIQIKCLHTVCTHTHTQRRTHHITLCLAQPRPASQQGQLHKENIFGGLAYFKAVKRHSATTHHTTLHQQGSMRERRRMTCIFGWILLFLLRSISAVTRACELLQLCRDGALILMTIELGR